MTRKGEQRTEWTDADVETLRNCLSAGSTFGQVADALGGKFSRSAVIGKASRIGAKSRVAATISSFARKKAPRASVETRPAKREVVTAAVVTVAAIKPPPFIRPAEPFAPLPGIEPVAFAENRACKWPVDGFYGKGLLVCGAPRDVDHHAYCGVHRTLSYQEPRTRKAA